MKIIGGKMRQQVRFGYEHLNVIDETTLSRMLIWVQPEKQVKKIRERSFKKNKNTLKTILNKKLLYSSKGVFIDNDHVFLSIYDSCQAFLSKMDDKKVQQCYEICAKLVKDSMKNVFFARCKHHFTLLLDGIVKKRCLFRDFSSDFEAKNADYDELLSLFSAIIASWDTNMGEIK